MVDIPRLLGNTVRAESCPAALGPFHGVYLIVSKEYCWALAEVCALLSALSCSSSSRLLLLVHVDLYLSFIMNTNYEVILLR